jgi:very-short-patch-repair endonuclease
MKWTHNIQDFRERRRELRKNSTETEQKLWFELRNNKLGVKFKRQHSIGGYIVDFYCQKYKLIIELDGEIHNTKEAQEYDAVRDKYFKELDYTVLRFKNEEVESDIEKVLVKIKSYF